MYGLLPLSSFDCRLKPTFVPLDKWLQVPPVCLALALSIVCSRLFLGLVCPQSFIDACHLSIHRVAFVKIALSSIKTGPATNCS